MVQTAGGLAKLWRCTYWYPSNTRLSDDASEYKMKAYADGDALVFESIPNDEGSYMFVRLTVTDGVAVGSWHETTSPTGEFKGANYNGSGQLIVNSKTHYMEGKWVGAGYDHKLKRLRVYTGSWELAPLKES